MTNNKTYLNNINIDIYIYIYTHIKKYKKTYDKS